MTARFEVLEFGVEGEPLVIIDDFSADPDAFKQQASNLAFGYPGPHYPGLRAQADPGYLAANMDVLREVLTDVFGMGQGAELVECAWSLVTIPPAELTLIQRLPHFDTTDAGRLALLHYFCDETEGGTAFYRHRSSGFECISDERHMEYTRLLQSEIESGDMPPQNYVRGNTPLFERTGQVEAKFNRMVIYRSQRLHSGDIPEDLPLSSDPSIGRLTLNTFLQARPA